MNKLSTGDYFGETNHRLKIAGVTLTETEYTHSFVDWHYHENAYFTFILNGQVLEGNKKEKYCCSPSSLLFHNWDDAHYNIKPDGYTRGFHIEIEQGWFNGFGLNQNDMRGSFEIANPDVKFLFYQLFMELKRNDNLSCLALESLLLCAFRLMENTIKPKLKGIPVWVVRLKGILADDPSRKYTLNDLAAVLGIHPIHLSRDFSKYFHCTLSEYLRKIRIERAFTMLSHRQNSLSTIAFECGFADQSHFLRCFKEYASANPSAYRRLLLQSC